MHLGLLKKLSCISEVGNSNPTERGNIRNVQNVTNKLIKQAKLNYFQKLGDKLTNPAGGQKSFRRSFKRILNKKKHTNIPPLIEGSYFVSNQLLSITSNFYESFESFDETRAVFLDISKSFDSVA